MQTTMMKGLITELGDFKLDDCAGWFFDDGRERVWIADVFYLVARAISQPQLSSPLMSCLNNVQGVVVANERFDRAGVVQIYPSLEPGELEFFFAKLGVQVEKTCRAQKLFRSMMQSVHLLLLPVWHCSPASVRPVEGEQRLALAEAAGIPASEVA